jgi:acyl-coenzyme A synthetase/AMP-(fatty) acid ligase
MPPQTNPLLDAWHAVCARRGGDVAVIEGASGHRWTFEELRVAAIDAAGRGTPESGVVCPAGQGVSMILEVLAAWEAGGLVCPVEAGSAVPDPEIWQGLRNVCPEAVLAKTTSGSTGAPRHVLFSADQLAADARAIVSTMQLHPGLPNVGAISLAHSYGFSNLVLPLLVHGIPLVLAASSLPASVRDALNVVAHGTAGGTRAAVPGVPALWRAWHAAGVTDPSRIAVALSAGAPLPLELEREVWAANGLKIHNFLGSSECGGIAYDRTTQPRDDATLVGTALDGVSLAVDAGGRLVVRSAAVGLGYWPQEPEARDTEGPALQAGTFRTGDLAEARGDAWHLLGRAADTINLAGRKLHPAELESLLRAHPAVKECLVFGIPSADPARGEEVVAAISWDGTRDEDWHSLPAWLGAHLPPWKRPRHWWSCPDLAATARGKLPRTEWRTRYLATMTGRRP